MKAMFDKLKEILPIDNIDMINKRELINNKLRSLTLKKDLIITGEKSILFIDISYYIFYRYYALCTWYNIMNSEKNKEKKDGVVIDKLDIPNIMMNTDFLSRFHRLFFDKILTFKKRHNVLKDAEVIFVKDCPRNEIWRHSIYDKYKANRESRNADFNIDIFYYVYEEIQPEMARYGMHIISLDKAEADDVIAILKMRIRNEFPKLPIYIITGDHDYIQLLDENTEIYNPQGINLRTKCKGEEPYIFSQLKIIRGDKSDNIPSALIKRISDEKLIEIIKNGDHKKPKFSEIIDEKQYKLNERLIDFNMIPLKMKEDINDLIKINKNT